VVKGRTDCRQRAIGGAHALTATSELTRLKLERELRSSSEEWARRQVEERQHITHRAVLLQSVTSRSAEAIAEMRTCIESLPTTKAATRAELSFARQECVKAALRSLCLVLDDDRRPDDPLKVAYFKATFFEYFPEPPSAGVLRREYWYYPDLIQPRTREWSIANDPNAAAVRAFITRQEVVLPRVANAAAKGSEWKDGRPGHATEYEQSSMVCIPVWTSGGDEKEFGGNTVMGILTVDTNQLDYFVGGEDARAARNELFGPFLGLIRLAYAFTSLIDRTAAVG
jgi:hypothetical protein